MFDADALKKLIEDSGLFFKTTKKSYVFTCPRCNKPDKLNIFRESGRFICWTCAETSGFKGAPELALRELLGLPIKQLRQLLYGDSTFAATEASFFSISLRDIYGDEEPPAELVQQTRGLNMPLNFFPIDHKHSSTGREYLASRGIDLDLAMQYRLHYAPAQKRVIFPCYVGDKLVAWQARFVLPHEWRDEETGEKQKTPKILTTGPRDQCVMFQDRLAGSDHVVLVEGPIDAVKCHLAGGNVATMGKIVSKRQLDIIRGAGVRKIYVGLDLDAGSESMGLLKEFSDYYDCATGETYEVYKLEPAPGYEDLGAMPVELVPEQMARASRVSPSSLFLGL